MLDQAAANDAQLERCQDTISRFLDLIEFDVSNKKLVKYIPAVQQLVFGSPGLLLPILLTPIYSLTCKFK